jgi:hypothetical protein
LSDERRLLTVDMGDDDEEEEDTPVDDDGVLRIAEPMAVPPPPTPPPELALAAEDGRAEEPTRSGRGGARPARVVACCLVLCICPESVPGADGADAAAPLVEAASLRRLRAARASWADCFRAAAEVDEVVSDATIVAKTKAYLLYSS